MNYEYFANGEKVVLEVDEDVIAVRFTEPAAYSSRAEAAAVAELGPFAARIEIPQEKFTIIPIAQYAQPRHERYQAAVTKMEQSAQVKRVAPVFKLNDMRAVTTDRLLLGLNTRGESARHLLQEKDLTVLEEFGDGGEFLVQLKPDVEPFALLSELAKHPEVRYVEPDFVIIGQHTARQVTLGPAGGDPLLAKQYAAHITKAVDAWQTTAADPAIKIAILDEGVDIAHEDLAAALVGGYDATDDDVYQEPQAWDGHGTACAGLAAGVPNNDLGVRGIGGGCSLLGVRIAYSTAPDARTWVTNSNWIRRAIDWAWRNQADVLSCSWGGGAPSTVITEAFESARTHGRNGKGCVVVIAAGNSSGPVTYPATLANVLTVSASNQYDEFKSRMSRDGEHWWGSNFGPEVDIAAPGVYNYTTDIMGAGGYNVQGHYIPDFNGTSSATPIVAGAAALMLSANPQLSEGQVRRLICDTADKVGGLAYYKGRNDQMGYGRLNVVRAVEAARQANGAGGVPSHNDDPKSQPGQPGENGAPAALASGQELTVQERELLVDQALILIDSIYVHLPLKRAMHAVDPMQRLKLLRHRLPKLSDRRFHNEMISIFTNLRDLHTSYQLPEPYNHLGFFLPFLMEEFYAGGERKYMASKVAANLKHPTFAPGVVITHWSGMPIERAIAINAERNAGSNEDARRARGLEWMTIRPLVMALPPDEEWVDVRYEAGGVAHELRFTWQSLTLASPASADKDAANLQLAGALALDVQTEAARRMKKMLFAPAAMQVEEQVARERASNIAMTQSGLDFNKVSMLPDNFSFRTVNTAKGAVGYIRIYAFAPYDKDPLFVEHFVQEFMRILALMPANGLIIDVRGNPGGYIYAGEGILQMLTSKRITPERMQFINTPLSLQLCTQVSWLTQWAHSVQLAVETGDIFSQPLPLGSEDQYNQIGQQYSGPVVLITDALCYSTTDIFAAGFQDHGIGPILGVHGNTGAGGASVWTQADLLNLLPLEPSLRPLPKGAKLSVAVLRASRVGERAGLPLEDLGVTPDQVHAMTERDLLQDNQDLIAEAVSLLFP